MSDKKGKINIILLCSTVDCLGFQPYLFYLYSYYDICISIYTYGSYSFYVGYIIRNIVLFYYNCSNHKNNAFTKSWELLVNQLAYHWISQNTSSATYALQRKEGNHQKIYGENVNNHGNLTFDHSLANIKQFVGSIRGMKE